MAPAILTTANSASCCKPLSSRYSAAICSAPMDFTSARPDNTSLFNAALDARSIACLYIPIVSFAGRPLASPIRRTNPRSASTRCILLSELCAIFSRSAIGSAVGQSDRARMAASFTLSSLSFRAVRSVGTALSSPILPSTLSREHRFGTSLTEGSAASTASARRSFSPILWATAATVFSASLRSASLWTPIKTSTNAGKSFRPATVFKALNDSRRTLRSESCVVFNKVFTPAAILRSPVLRISSTLTLGSVDRWRFARIVSLISGPRSQ